jgi:2-dehydro-3-deoxyphosphooctonate aldolase (KDO 8-P synthase)
MEKIMKLLAGPCVIESEENIFKIAKELEIYQDDKEIDFYFKASFDKANRTSLESFRGLGIDKGLEILQKVKDDFGYKIVTDVHESTQVEQVAKVVDMLQIPAFLCRQTDLLVACAKTSREINIKKGQFLSGSAMKYPLLKVLQTRGCDEATYENSQKHGVYLCERGNSFGYGNMVVVDHGPAPLVVVVGDVVGVVARPPAAGDAVVAGHEFVAHRFLVDCTALRLGPVMGSDGTLPQPPTRRQS